MNTYLLGYVSAWLSILLGSLLGDWINAALRRLDR